MLYWFPLVQQLYNCRVAAVLSARVCVRALGELWTHNTFCLRGQQEIYILKTLQGRAIYYSLVDAALTDFMAFLALESNS